MLYVFVETGPAGWFYGCVIGGKLGPRIPGSAGVEVRVGQGGGLS